MDAAACARDIGGRGGARRFERALGARRPPVIQKGTKLTYWGGLIFSDAANKLLTNTINMWGADNGVQTEVVMVNQNETVQRVSAAVESKTMPDALDLDLDLLLLLSRQGVFVPLDDLYASIGSAQGGWFRPVETAVAGIAGTGGRTGIPFGVSGNLLLRRNDILAKAGFTTAAATWGGTGETSSRRHETAALRSRPRTLECR